MKKNENNRTIQSILDGIKRPKKVVVTGGMPYANGPLHLGHLAGALVPPDILARYMRMLIGKENVLFVCGTDDHGSTSEIAALKAQRPIHEFIKSVHKTQYQTMKNYSISLDNYTGTSHPETFPLHTELCQDILRKLYKNNMLVKKTSKQWFDPELQRFLPDRYVSGTCPNENCDNKNAYSDNCDVCGKSYGPSELINPISVLGKTTPILKDTDHLWLDMWKVSDIMREWIEGKKKVWRKGVYQEVINTVMPCFSFDKAHEEQFKDLKEILPKHKSRYAPGKKIVVQFQCLSDLNTARDVLDKNNIKSDLQDEWAHRSISRDVSWGIPLPEDLDPELKGKTLYVWPDSLIAPLSFSQIALEKKGIDKKDYKAYWCDPDAKIYQFLGQDNVFFYIIMQAALWLGSQDDINRLPVKGELQLNDVFGRYHLQINNEKMSKSTGNYYTGDQLLEKGYSSDQIRYFLALLSLPEKSSNFDFTALDDRNKFLAGPLNASFEKPISACHSKFNSIIPQGKLIAKISDQSYKIIQNYVRSMEKAEYSKLLFTIENYARLINGLFMQFKPHDDRFPEEERKDALYSSFYILRNLVIMLSPFAPSTMEKLRISLNLPESIYNIDELGRHFPENHKINKQTDYFPSVGED